MADRIPLYYTFGNHMHWVDFHWLWGYHVLPHSIRDMQALCREAGVKGCVNFDGIGYEKLASEDPEAFAELKASIREGLFEVVGGSYGQPYGLFHGGESNVRQRVYGIRTARRLFGVDVKTFWEEEFDFFPQLPQMLRGVGIEYGSLFFQWTWHTPEVPKEDVPVVWWEAPDGSRLLCATRNRLNLHQWPEDMDILLAELAAGSESGVRNSKDPIPLIQQWLELMPSPDWMCRSELILPKLRELFADERFEVRAVTLGEYLRGIHDTHRLEADATPVRRYSLDDVWHGMTLGKNGDNMRRLSREAEASALSAETLAAIAGLLGRPYAQWDVYPTWELEEAWRELLSAQHHDNDECERLCGYMGRFSYERSIAISSRIARWTLRTIVGHLGGRRHESAHPSGQYVGGRYSFSEVDGVARDTEMGPSKGNILLGNPLGWARDIWWPMASNSTTRTKFTLPAFGFVVFNPWALRPKEQPKEKYEPKPRPTGIAREDCLAELDLATGGIRQLTSNEFPEGCFTEGGCFDCSLRRSGEDVSVFVKRTEFNQELGRMETIEAPSDDLETWVRPAEHHRGFEIHYSGRIDQPDAGMNAAMKANIRPSFNYQILRDSAYGVTEAKPDLKGLKKYPTGDWMTSPQWFEEIHGAFTSLSFVDLVDIDNPDRGLLIVHNGSQQWLKNENGTLSCIISAYDPWDEEYFVEDIHADFWILPHGPLTNSQRWRLAQELNRGVHLAVVDGESVKTEPFCPLTCSSENVVMTAFYRETRDCAKGQAAHAADVLGVDYPYVLRLVEFDGIETETTLTFGATVAGAVRTNLLGEPEGSAEVVSAREVHIKMRPYEIATVYLDLVEGRKQVRDLDAKREVWATVHRVD